MSPHAPDIIEPLGHSQIQHGKANDRIYLMRLDERDMPGLIERLDALARRQGYSKIFCKVPASARAAFVEAGYLEEARVPGFFGGHEDGHFVSRFLADWRLRQEDAERIAQVLQAAQNRQGEGFGDELPEDFAWRECTPADAPAMAEVYGEVFASYPFPIHDPAWLVETMATHVRYVGAWKGERLAALASAEMDREHGHVEMTDFATLPDFRGLGLSVYLLARMEQLMRDQGLPTAFTIARSVEFGMNITFARLDYRYAGTLVNNTHISGRFESMSVWHKRLDGPRV